MSSTIKKLSTGAAFGVAAKVITAGAGFLVSALLARSLPTEAVGAYFLVINTTGVLANGVRLGSDMSVMKYLGILVKGQSGAAFRDLLLKYHQILGGAFGVFVVLTTMLWNELIKSFSATSIQPYLWLLIIISGLRAYEGFLSAALRGAGHLRLGVVLQDTPRQVLLLAVLSLLLLFAVPPIEVRGVLTLYAGAAAVPVAFGVAMLIVVTISAPNISRGGTEQPTKKELLQVSIPIYVTALTNGLGRIGGLWILTAVASETETAIYGVTVQLASLITVLLTVVNRVLPPTIASLAHSGNAGDLEKITRTVAGISFAVVIPVIIALLFFGETILGLAFGSVYKAGALALFLLAAGRAVDVFCGSSGIVLQMSGLERLLMGITVATTVAGLMLAWRLGSAFGVTGAAAGALVMIVVQNIAMARSAYLRLGVKTWANFTWFSALWPSKRKG